MSSLSRALLKAMVSLLHPKMFLLMLLPVAAAIMLWMIVGVALWAQAVSLLEESMRAWDALQWLLAYWPLTLVAAHATWAVLILLMVPVVIVTTVLVVGTFAMPMMVSHVASRHYATLEERHGGTFLGSAWNGIAALAWFALLALVTSPLWLLPPAWPLLTLGLLAYLNQRVFRHDALALHASVEELQYLARHERWSLLALGACVALAAHAPLLGFFAPVYGGLVFIHFLLDRLRAMRAEPIDAEWSRVPG